MIFILLLIFYMFCFTTMVGVMYVVELSSWNFWGILIDEESWSLTNPMYPLQSVKSLQQDIIHNHWSFCITTVLAISNWRTQRHRDSNLACNFSLWAVNVTAHYIEYSPSVIVDGISKSLVLIWVLSTDSLQVYWGNKIIHCRFCGSYLLCLLYESMKTLGWIIWVSFELTFSHNPNLLPLGFEDFWLYVYFYNFAVY